MSKRFGRNQKRKLKEKVAHLERENSGYALNNLDLKEQINEWSYKIKEIFGKDSAFNCHPPEYISSGLKNRVVPIPLTSAVDDEMFGSATFNSSVVMMHRFTSCLDYLPSECALLLKVVEKDANTNSAYYSISESHFHRFGIDREGIRHFALQIAQKLITHINANRGSHSQG